MATGNETKHRQPSWAIETKGVTKFFGDYPALAGIDLKVKPGELAVIFGPNGAGKTTLIKVLATIMKPSSGEILINGLNLKDNTEKIRRQLGVVTHQTFLYSNLTAYENLEFYGRMYDVVEYKRRIHEVVAMLGMTSRLHDRMGTLSRGMQQRISIARSLLPEPSIMLLDEPETGLDPQTSAILWEILPAGKGGKRTIILTTHSLERGLELGEHLLILSRGKVVYEGAKQELDLPSLKEVYQNSTRTEYENLE